MTEEAPFSNREIKEFFKVIDEKLDRTMTQTTKTNGNVISLRLWRAYTTGAIAILIPVVTYLAVRVLNTPQYPPLSTSIATVLQSIKSQEATTTSQ